MLADLHIHTTFSDGLYTPEQIIAQARASGITALAITDHDNIQAYDRASRTIHSRHLDLQLIRGVEIDTDYKGRDVHVLGYHFDPENRALLQAMTWTRVGRIARIRKIIEKVNGLGYPLTFAEVRQEANGSKSLGRPHIARVLVKKGLFSHTQAVFDALIASGRPAYCRQVKLLPQEAVALLHGAGGLAVLAHPAEIRNPELAEELLDTVPFDGLEVWHPSVLQEQPHHDWLQTARDHGLLTSGGSDLHGNPGRFPRHLGEFPVSYQDVAGIVSGKRP